MSSLKKIVDEEFISRFFRNIARQKEVSVSVCYKNKQIEGTMFFTARRGNEPNLRTYDPNINFLVGENIEITFHNSEVLFFFRSDVTSGYKNSYTIDKPSILFSSFRRLMSRYRMSENDNSYVQFVNNERRYNIFDISTSGIAFISQDEKFTKGSIYRDIAIIINDDLKIYFDGVIKHIRVAANGEYIYGMNFTNMELASQNMLFLYTFRKIYPRLIFLKEASTEDILNLYEKSHYFEYANKDSQNILSCSDTYIKGFQDISENSTITSGLIFYKSDKPLAMGSVVRIYNRTFIGHQIISLPETKIDTNPIKEVQSALCDFMINHSSFEYFISYIILDFQSLLDYYIGVEGIINDNNRFKVDTLQCIECNCDEYTTFSEPGDFECTLLENTEEFIEFCKSKLSQIEFMSYSYNSTQVQLAEIKQIYNALELFIDRRIWCIKNAGKVAAYAVAECYTDGINLFNSLDILRVYFTTDVFDINNIFEALIPQAIIFYQDNNKNVFYIHLDDEQVGAKDINIPGLNYRYPVGRIISNKEGVIEYKKFLNGELISIPRQYKLTHPQLAIWYTEKVYPGTSFGNIAEMVIIKDELDLTSLERAINQVIHSNIGLRLRFTEEDGEPRQYVVKYNYSNIEFYDFSQIGGFDGLYNWDEYKNGACFKLLDSDLYYFAIFKVDDENCGFYIKTHHLISDAWTIANLLISKIVEYYGLLKNNKNLSRKLMPSYIDYILREEEYKNTVDFDESKKFWKDKFGTVPEVINIKPSKLGYRDTKAKRKTFIISMELTSQILEYSKLYDNSPLTIFLSILSILFNKLTGKNDIVLGTPVLNRSNRREKETVGMFISIAPVRINLEDGMSFGEFVNYVNFEWKQVLKNQKYPYDLILGDFRDNYKINDNLYDVVLSYQNAKHEKTEVDYSTEWVFTGHQTDSLVVHISDRDDNGCFKFDFDYLINIFKDDEIEQMFELMINILKDSISNPIKKINCIEFISDREKHKLLYEFNNTKRDYPNDKTIHQLFEEQVEETPDNIALVFKNKCISYLELNQKSNQLARVLRQKGISSEDVVGIMVDQSMEMLIGIMGILKAGGAFLPIDPTYPSERIQYMLHDSKIKILLTLKYLIKNVIYAGEIVDLGNKYNYSGDVANIGKTNNSENLAYIIYTSGSTGKPKGVMIEHKALVNLCYWHTDYYGVTVKDRSTKYAGFGFDASAWELFPYLIVGASIYIIDNDIKLDICKLNKFYEKNKISISFLPTQICEQFMQNDNKILRKLLTGGDKLKKYTKKSYNVINNYGPTENTVVSTSFLVEGINSNIPIGRPIYNTEIYILGDKGNLMPIGIPGELCISGAGLARGYLGKKELTDDKFVLNPYKPEERMYKTGDLARWLPNGNIEFLGRIDHQVKIRGFRIELGEIENVLLSCIQIKEAIVILREDKDGNKYLSGYFVADNILTIQELRKHLSKELPDYMIPASFIQLEKMPLTSNGKIDREALVKINGIVNSGAEYIEPENEIEEILVKIWQDVLEVKRVGINDNFFELGGDSILLIRVLASVSVYNWNITMQDFYQFQTIKSLCDKMKRTIEANDNIKRSTTQIIQKRATPKNEKINLNSGKIIMRNILITGSTGYLGSHLLHELVKNPQANIYCIVRGENITDSNKRLINTLKFYFPEQYKELFESRIFVINGDITKKRLGLSNKEYTNLGKNIDTIYHCAAIVKHFGNYSDFEKINVHGTENIIKFSAQGKMKLNYISTISISGDLFNQKEKNFKFTENDLLIGQNYDDNVYIRSKIETEKNLFNEMNRGLDVSIFRVGNLTGRYNDGCFQLNISDSRFYNMLKTMCYTGVISNEMIEMIMEFTPVDYCSNAIIELSRISDPNNKIFHLYNHKIIKMKDIIEMLDFLGIKIKILEDSQYKIHMNQILKGKKNDFILKGLISSFNGEKSGCIKPTITVSSKITIAHLNELGFEWPEINIQYIKKVIAHMKNVNYMNLI